MTDFQEIVILYGAVLISLGAGILGAIIIRRK